ncbi:heterokaryon incompatibility protein-domain-containing protein [Chaetomium sp. MPI-CAGE-AT-0009]|nr:heterokaryon incompatibility protein-domain-containing protein [Chaetomium sp. MPI-CAGE-AT-0009]
MWESGANTITVDSASIRSSPRFQSMLDVNSLPQFWLPRCNRWQKKVLTYLHSRFQNQGGLLREAQNLPRHFCQFCEEFRWNSSVRRRPASAFRDSASAGCSYCKAIDDSVQLYEALRPLSHVKDAVRRLWPHQTQDPDLHIAVQMKGSSHGCHLKVTLTTSTWPHGVGSFNVSPVFDVLNDGDDGLDRRIRSSKFRVLDRVSLEKHVNFDFISQRLHHCVCNHPNCGASKPCFKPTRLIHVGNEGTEPYLAVNLPNPVPYAALSYCWGDASGTIRTTRGNLASLQNSISIASLPQTIRDAVFVCRKLGVHYLWVDALCIIQDSEGQRDWYTEAAQMREVYSCAIFVIAAHDSPSSTSGFLQKRRFMPEVTKYSPRFNTVYWLLNSDSRALRDSILATRGWALQEQLLASRIIHFTDSELIWGCSAGLQSESGRTSYLQLMDLTHLVTNGNAARLPVVRRDTGDSRADQNINNFLQAKGTASLYWVWRQIVTDYSRRHLTRAEDKLVALSGVAKVFASRLAINPEDSYLAGLWKDALMQDLLWEVTEPSSATCGVAGRTYIAPSWSWASISGAVRYFFSEYQFKFESLAEVLDVSCEQASTDPTGAVTGGSLKITGQFQSVVLEIKTRPTGPSEWRSKTIGFVYEPGEDEVRFFPDKSMEIGVYSQGYHCVLLGANVDRFSEAKRFWFLVVQETGTRETDGLRVVERTGIGFLHSTDCWLLYSEFETVVLV